MFKARDEPNALQSSAIRRRFLRSRLKLLLQPSSHRKRPEVLRTSNRRQRRRDSENENAKDASKKNRKARCENKGAHDDNEGATSDNEEELDNLTASFAGLSGDLT